MSRTRYERPRRTTPAERGHGAGCAYTDNFGESCNCDGSISETSAGVSVRARITADMAFAGWTLGARSGRWLRFERSFGDHTITITRLASGWGLLWYRGYGWTILEDYCYGTASACLNALLEHMVAYHEVADQVMAELAQVRIAEGKSKPAQTLTLVPEDPDGGVGA